MGSIFDEMKKIKKNLQASQPENAQPKLIPRNQGSNSNRPVFCPACRKKLPLGLLKKHLVQEHGVPEKLPIRDAIALVTEGHLNAQQVYGGVKSHLAPNNKQQKEKTHVNQPSDKRKSAQQQAAQKNALNRSETIQGRDLAGFTKQTVKLLTGRTHEMYVKYTNMPLASNTRAQRADKQRSQSEKPAATSKPATPTPRKVSTAVTIENPAPPIRSFKLARVDEFKFPDDWVSQGGETTLTATGRAFDAYMGIDFGTAFTKASVGYGSDIYIVDWAGVKASEAKFTLPGEFSVLGDGTCVLGRTPLATRVATDLKLPFLERNASPSSLVDATLFLALVMRYIRAWWFHGHHDLIRNQPLKWNVNLGAPTTPWQDKKLRTSYTRVAQAAWTISLGHSPIRSDSAISALGQGSHNSPPIMVVAEFVAQIASYTRSPQRQHDLHLLVDIGAGTVDVVTFNVNKDEQTGEDQFPIFWASVNNLGTHYLMSRRLQDGKISQGDHQDDAITVPSAEKFSQATGLPIQVVRRSDRTHASAVAGAISAVLRTTKQKRYRRSPRWQTGIRVFLCGGGSACEAFQVSIVEAGRRSGVPLPPIKLPLPERLRAPGLPQDQFHRVSVAFGLGMDAFNLGQIRPMAAVEDDTPIPMKERPHNTDFEDK